MPRTFRSACGPFLVAAKQVRAKGGSLATCDELASAGSVAVGGRCAATIMAGCVALDLLGRRALLRKTQALVKASRARVKAAKRSLLNGLGAATAKRPAAQGPCRAFILAAKQLRRTGPFLNDDETWHHACGNLSSAAFSTIGATCGGAVLAACNPLEGTRAHRGLLRAGFQIMRGRDRSLS